VFLVKQLLAGRSDSPRDLEEEARGRSVSRRELTAYVLELLGHSSRTIRRVMDTLYRFGQVAGHVVGPEHEHSAPPTPVEPQEPSRTEPLREGASRTRRAGAPPRSEPPSRPSTSSFPTSPSLRSRNSGPGRVS
jgi:hypothetical protein